MSTIDISIKVEDNRSILKTVVRGTQVEYGLKKLKVGGWVKCTEKSLVDYYQDGKLTAHELESLEDIDLIELHKAFHR